MSKIASPVAAEMPSNDSCSTDGEVLDGSLALLTPIDQSSKLRQMFKVSEKGTKLIDIDSKVGLNGSHTHWSFPCMHDEESQRFYVWLGDVSIEKFTKTTLMNLVSFAEKAGSTKMVLVMDREHPQKGKIEIH